MLVKCRSIQEVLNNKKIDEPIKLFMLRDTFGLFGSYFIFADRRGDEDFIISDAYSVGEYGEADGFRIKMFAYYPISSSRIIILAGNGVEYGRQEIIRYSKDILKKPVPMSGGKKIRFRVRKLYQKDVNYINNLLKYHASQGFAYADENRVSLGIEDIDVL